MKPISWGTRSPKGEAGNYGPEKTEDTEQHKQLMSLSLGLHPGPRFQALSTCWA